METNTGIKIAHFWDRRTTLSIREHLMASEVKADMCPLTMAEKSGFTFWMNKRGSNMGTSVSGFIAETSVACISGMLPMLQLQCMNAEPFGVSASSDIEVNERTMFTTPLMFGYAKGMTIADLLANHFTAYEFQEIKEILVTNAEKFAINKVLCAGIDCALQLVDKQNIRETARIVQQYSNRPLVLLNNSWEEVKQHDNGYVFCTKLDININPRAAAPVLVRVTSRTSASSEDSAVKYPYPGNQIKAVYVTMTIEEFKGQLLYPMEHSSRRFHERLYDAMYHPGN